MLKLHPSWSRTWWCLSLMAQAWMLIYLLFLLYFCFRPTGPWCKTYSDDKLCNNVLYSDIFSYILITIDDITSCMYCHIHVGAPSLSFKPGDSFRLLEKPLESMWALPLAAVLSLLSVAAIEDPTRKHQSGCLSTAVIAPVVHPFQLSRRPRRLPQVPSSSSPWATTGAGLLRPRPLPGSLSTPTVIDVERASRWALVPPHPTSMP
jgi:hypothetical protein